MVGRAVPNTSFQALNIRMVYKPIFGGEKVHSYHVSALWRRSVGYHPAELQCKAGHNRRTTSAAQGSFSLWIDNTSVD